jgi:membrane protease YdiL (CAAX protease family)
VPFTIIGLLVLLWARVSRKPLTDLGFCVPKSPWRTVLLGVVSGAVFKLLMKALVMPLFGAPEANQTYHYLAGNAAALPGAILLMLAGGGFGEETVFRGFLFDRLGIFLGRGAGGKTATVLVTTLLFASLHYADQGLPGVEQALVTGLVFGTIFALTNDIWIVMASHAAFDLMAVALIYWNEESAVAHLIFR